MPGFHLRILAVSDDYSGLCLVADESYTLEAPSTRTAVRTALLPVIEIRQPAVSLSQEEGVRLGALIRMAGEYLASDTSLREELLGNLYSLFLTDVSSIILRRTQHVKMGKRAEELFMDFMQMLPQHFVREHGIDFYASALGVTSTYLSRVVREVSGRTVVEYINRMLTMEALWLLENTSLSIDEIAERIHYADSTTFGRIFFRRYLFATES